MPRQRPCRLEYREERERSLARPRRPRHRRGSARAGLHSHTGTETVVVHAPAFGGSGCAPIDKEYRTFLRFRNSFVFTISRPPRDAAPSCKSCPSRPQGRRHICQMLPVNQGTVRAILQRVRNSSLLQSLIRDFGTQKCERGKPDNLRMRPPCRPSGRTDSLAGLWKTHTYQ